MVGAVQNISGMCNRHRGPRMGILLALLPRAGLVQLKAGGRARLERGQSPGEEVLAQRHALARRGRLPQLVRHSA